MLPLVLLFVKEISSLIVERNQGYFQVPTPFDLVKDQREYGFPDDMLNRMHKLEIKFDSSESRFPARNINDYHGSETESEIVKRYSNAENGFGYYIRRRAVFILSGAIVAVTDGGRLLYNAYPADVSLTGNTDMAVDPSTTTFGFPQQFHDVLARKVSSRWKGSQPTPRALNKAEANVDNDMQTQLNAIAHIDESEETIGLNMPSQDLGNDGYNY